MEGRKDKYLISIGRTLAVVTWDGESDKVSDTVVLAEVDNTPDTLDNRFNDGKCDPSGRLWAGDTLKYPYKLSFNIFMQVLWEENPFWDK